jgi:predicted outer membrane repeat protein
VVDRCTTDVESGGTNLAQALGRGGRITFNCPGPATIRITRPHRISRSFDLDGGGTVTLDGGGEQTFVEGVAPNLSMRLANVTVQNMFSTHTSGVIDGDLGLKIEIANSRILDSELPIGIAQGEVVVTDSQFERNRNAAISAPVVVLTRSAIRATDGQPVFSRIGAVTITDSEITDNLSGSVFHRCSRVVITRTQFRNNREPSTGEREGGAAFRTDCDTEVENATFADNRSASNGGAIFARGAAARITIRGSRFTGNTAQLSGGAIAIEAAVTAQRLMLQHTVFRGNGAKRGGAIWMPPGMAGGRAELAGVGVTFTANVAAERGGAIATEGVVVALSRAAFIRNAAPAVAAVAAGPVPGTVNGFVNALFVLNAGGGAAFEGSGAQFVNVTILGSQGAGIALSPAGPQAPIRLANTIVENNRGGNCLGDAAGIVSEGGNLQFPGTSCGTGISVAAAMLDTFYAPMIGGAARGNGRDEICLGPLVRGRDFYGKRRPEADHCSIGAVEGDLKRTVEMVKGTSPAPPGDTCTPAATSNCECAALPAARSGQRGTEQAERRLTALAALGVDFSVDETELLSWLDTPDFTPYPAIADALTELMGGRPLRCPVPIDVIVFNYEHTPGAGSPRRPADVRPEVLEAALVEGYNNRHGTAYTKLSDLLR